MIGIFDTWVINTHSDEGHGFVGRYFFDTRTTIPETAEGCHYAMFKTRKIARRYLPQVRRAFPKAKVEHVAVRVIEQGKSEPLFPAAP